MTEVKGIGCAKGRATLRATTHYRAPLGIEGLPQVALCQLFMNFPKERRKGGGLPGKRFTRDEFTAASTLVVALFKVQVITARSVEASVRATVIGVIPRLHVLLQAGVYGPRLLRS